MKLISTSAITRDEFKESKKRLDNIFSNSFRQLRRYDHFLYISNNDETI